MLYVIARADLNDSFKFCFLGCVACICSNARHVLSCDFDGEIILWDINSRELLDVLDMSSNDFCSQSGLEYLQEADLKSRHISISDDSQFAAVALEGVFTLVMIRIENGERQTELQNRFDLKLIEFDLNM